jgi:prephenate dehydrogenase
MGASLARAARAVDGALRVVAVEPQDELRARALADGVADEAHAGAHDALSSCEAVVLCTPVAEIERLLAPVSARMADGALLTDVGGAKERIVGLAAERVRRGVPFVGAHPMFGGHGGYAGAAEAAARWRGGRVAVCTDGDPAAVARAEALFGAVGATPIRCRAAEHDAAVATVSHLPYLVASALALAARDAGPLAAALAGAGLRDATRLAQFPFDVQGEVARRNAHLPAAAGALSRHLGRVLEAVAASPEAARAALEDARAAREALFPGGRLP